MLRVIAGKYGKRQLEQPPLDISRPTMDRVREATFSMIQFDVPGAVVLDLFSGSGAFAIEAVSRGAAKAIAIEKSKQAIEVINGNVSKLGINNIDVIKDDVIAYLPRLSGTKFDFIFMDPPYKDFDLYDKTLKQIAEFKLLKDQGLIILETSHPDKISIPEGLTIHKQRKYGISNIVLIANNI